MKRRWNYFVPLALAFAVTPAMAMELGPIRVESTLDSPLLAEIPIVEDYPGEANGLKAALASGADFAQAGIRRADLRTPLKFRVVGRSGHRAIRVTSTKPVRAPFLDMLIKVTWPKGKLLREYTVLLDPAGSQWQAASATSGSAGAVSQATASTATPPATQAPATPQPQAATASSSITVDKGDTLFGIATSHPISGVDQNQMLLALKSANPDAFFQNNINALLAGTVLRMPTRQQALAVDRRAAAAAVLSQNHAWQNAQQPAIATSAGTGTKAGSTAIGANQEKPATQATPAAGGDHLSLVPPAKDEGVAAAGAATLSADASAKELRQALARSKESLSSQTQHASDLQSRVDALEGLQKKTQQLLTLKNTEIATLREELAKTRKKAGLPAPAASVATAPAPASLAGTGAAAASAAVAADAAGAGSPSDETASSASPTTQSASVGGSSEGTAGENTLASVATLAPATAATSAAVATVAVAQGTASEAGATQSQPNETQAGATDSQPNETDDAGATSDQQQASTLPTVTSAAAEQPAKDEQAAVQSPSKPAVAAATDTSQAPASDATPAKPAAATAVKASSAAVATPWYEELWARLVLGLIVVLLIVAWAVTRRRPRDVLVGPGNPGEPIAPSLTDEDALSVADGEDADAVATTDDGEGELLRQLAANPEDVGLHLELASLYYARGDVDRFEAVAESMHAYLDDDTQPEWHEVVKMGRELAPDHPLFVDVPATDEATTDDVNVGDWSRADLDTDEDAMPESPADGDYAGLAPLSAAAEEAGDDAAAPTWHFMTETVPDDENSIDDDDLPPLDMSLDNGLDNGPDQNPPSVEPDAPIPALADDASAFGFDMDAATDSAGISALDDVARHDAEPLEPELIDLEPLDVVPDDEEGIGMRSDAVEPADAELFEPGLDEPKPFDAELEDTQALDLGPDFAFHADSTPTVATDFVHAEPDLPSDEAVETETVAPDLATTEDPLPASDLAPDNFSGDAVDTKLDLARAYIELNDGEGARAMLQEALDEGSQMQRDVAQKLLDGLA